VAVQIHLPVEPSMKCTVRHFTRYLHLTVCVHVTTQVNWRLCPAPHITNTKPYQRSVSSFKWRTGPSRERFI